MCKLKSEGEKILRFKVSVQAMMARAVNEGVFPGAVLALWHDGKTYLEAFGWRAYLPRLEANHLDTIYDLASLTKPLATTFCIMRLISEGRLDIETSLAHHFDVPHWFRKVRLWHLLSHSAGLPSHRPYFASLITYPFEKRRRIFMDWTLAEPLSYPLGKKHIYSDLGFFLLGELIHKITGVSLAAFFEETLRLSFKIPPELMFNPRFLGVICDRVAPTEVCPWRGKLLRGEVHDENTWVLGGVAGQAGLFGTAEGVLILLKTLLLVYLGERICTFLTKELVSLFWDWKSHVGTWALGFDRPRPNGSSAGNLISRKAVGHLGFTGTSFWIDPERALIIILLSNRIHPTRNQTKLRAFRPVLHDLLIREYC